MTEQKPRWAVEGVLSDEMLDRHRARLGRRWESEGLLDRSAIQIFARAIGDSNPPLAGPGVRRLRAVRRADRARPARFIASTSATRCTGCAA